MNEPPAAAPAPAPGPAAAQPSPAGAAAPPPAADSRAQLLAQLERLRGALEAARRPGGQRSAANRSVRDWLTPRTGPPPTPLPLPGRAAGAPPDSPTSPTSPTSPIRQNGVFSGSAASDGWPAPLAPEALHGLAGDFVRLVEPHTEADTAALLGQFLVAFGNLAGRSAHVRAEADEHDTNLFLVLVGRSAKGRKGVAWGHTRRALHDLDRSWARTRIKSGLSSGEGVISAVRDGGEQGGASDHRLLIMEREFGGALRVMRREGNTLSAVLRAAWDDGDLATLTKEPLTASGAHISLIGHITVEELRRYLSDVDTTNGLANRILWVCTRRSKTLPEGGTPPEQPLRELQEQLELALRFAAGAGELRRNEAARELWRGVYEELAEPRPGLWGAATGRAEAQVLRLAMLYALLDITAVIGPEHLQAALAFWRYCDASARYVFGDALGDPVADRIRAALRAEPMGLTRTDLFHVLNRKVSAERIDDALALLQEYGMVSVRWREVAGQRPAQIWSLTPAARPAGERSARSGE